MYTVPLYGTVVPYVVPYGTTVKIRPIRNFSLILKFPFTPRIYFTTQSDCEVSSKVTVVRRHRRRNEYRSTCTFQFNTRIALNAPVLYVSSFEIKVRIIRVFVCSGNTTHRRMWLGPKLKMGEKNSCRVQFSDELSPVPSRSEADIRKYVSF